MYICIYMYICISSTHLYIPLRYRRPSARAAAVGKCFEVRINPNPTLTHIYITIYNYTYNYI